MVPRPDPYRVLGLVPGASSGEIRSAYRRLAKLHHPDTAGERSLGRFLAIRAAYEELVDAEGRLRSRGWPRGGATTSYRTADAGAKSASRDAWRARQASSTGSSGGASANRSGSSGATDAAGAKAGSSAKQGSGAKQGSSAKPGAGAKTEGAKPGGSRASEGASSPKTSRTTGQGRGGPRAGGTRTRAERRTARPGSTTYDEAKQPLDPSWAGGEWYGASSGRYWTLNPREYADPRKHGPEYQERARRAADLEATRHPNVQAISAEPPPPPSFASNHRPPSPPSPAAQPEGARANGIPPKTPETEAPDPARTGDAPGTSNPWSGTDPTTTTDPASPADRLRRLVHRSGGHGTP